MRRFALPLIILAVTIILIVLIALGSSGAVDYSGGKATAQPMSQEWARGNTAARVVLMGYSDFQCPACRAYEPLIRQVESLYGDRVAFVYRHFPLYRIHPNADIAARASEAAGIQGKFWELHDVLFAQQTQWANQPSAEAFIISYATALNLDIPKFKADLNSAEVKQAVADDYARGLAIGVDGTPTFVLNGVRVIDKPSSVDEFKVLLDAALAK